MISELWGTILELLKLTAEPDVLWTIVLPLAIGTIVMVVYFQKYRDERPGWNGYVANSLILIFISVALFRHIYEIDIFGFGNYIAYVGKTLAVFLLLLIGSTIVNLNFGHFLPEAVSRHVSSPLGINTFAYVVILYVQTSLENSFILFLSLIIILIVLLIVFNFIKWPLRKFFDYTRKIKEKEKVKDLKEEKFEITELKKELKYRRQRLEKSEIKELDKQKKEAVKLKRVIRGR